MATPTTQNLDKQPLNNENIGDLSPRKHEVRLSPREKKVGEATWARQKLEESPASPRRRFSASMISPRQKDENIGDLSPRKYEVRLSPREKKVGEATWARQKLEESPASPRRRFSVSIISPKQKDGVEKKQELK